MRFPPYKISTKRVNGSNAFNWLVAPMFGQRICFNGCGKPNTRAAFTLVEMLAVIAIVSIIGALSVRAVNGLMVSRGVSAALDQCAALLDFAKNEAITRQTYVWVGIQEAEVDGTLQTQMAAFFSADGTANDDSDNIVAMGQILRIQGAGLVKFTNLKAHTRNLWSSDAAPTELLESTAGLSSLSLPQMDFENGNTITFTPRGEAMLIGLPGPTNGFDPSIAFGIVPARGTIKLTDNEDAAVVLDGSTGSVRKLRHNL